MISAGLSIREYGGYVFVNLHGELDVSDAASVADALTAVAFRNPRIIVDLAALVFIDCSALGELSRVRARARPAGGDLLLAAPAGKCPERVRPGTHPTGPCHATDEEGLTVALHTTEPADNRSDRGPDHQRKASLLSLWLAFKRLTEFGFPRRFPIVQFPNLPLIVAFLAGAAGAFLDGSEHSYAAAVSYLALTIWAYEELVHGVNWFRRLLGLTFVILLIMRVAHAVHP